MGEERDSTLLCWKKCADTCGWNSPKLDTFSPDQCGRSGFLETTSPQLTVIFVAEHTSYRTERSAAEAPRHVGCVDVSSIVHIMCSACGLLH
jgi:hypothetical protein